MASVRMTFVRKSRITPGRRGEGCGQEEHLGLYMYIYLVITEREQRGNVQDLEELSTEELQALVDRARRILAERKLEQGRSLRVVDSFREGDTRYLLEYTKCGMASKGKCRKCREGEFHGPYWYSYTWDGKKMLSKYHGKSRPGSKQGEEQ